MIKPTDQPTDHLTDQRADMRGYRNVALSNQIMYSHLCINEFVLQDQNEELLNVLVMLLICM